MQQSLQSLLERLRDEHSKDFVYRGQVKRYADPLVPSIFRTWIKKDGAHLSDSNTFRTLRSVDSTTFVETLSPVAVLQNMGSIDRTKYLKRLRVSDIVRTGLGYVLTEVFCQQCGLQSEGLDVTSSLDVATFFATHEFVDGSYKLVTDPYEGVIYRWKVDSIDVSLNFLQTTDFYRCPVYLPSTEILGLFNTCESFDECMDSFDQFRISINFGDLLFDLEEIRYNRPLDILKFPERAVQASRIVAQAAGLLIPDQILSREWLNVYSPPEEKYVNGDIRFIEDLTKRKGTDTFIFSHSVQDACQVHVSPYAIFPKRDISFFVVRDWFRHFLMLNEQSILKNGGMYLMPSDDVVQNLILEETTRNPFFDPADEFLV